ncbi:hypothetical protein PDESU_01860 [Pontiella desulfatans]|uniref:3-keto-alpha-glucoside-1,2-lyase/3-keto-2-hydroxy-glucal hydratase domain-containing protein n=1 Tax=Pontiella desulfatans TaxID=2750659 RepID=A0A6C2U0Q5_PONDE|nr:family 16 glycoside hydrolase [Pontiella desulfatans]VGO13304.1 hypothetical protein PDESU_01860 [Pontiella desulfatans]
MHLSKCGVYLAVAGIMYSVDAAIQRWEASDLDDGAVITWVSQGELGTTASLPAANGGDPTKDADGVYFDGNDALEVPSGSNFLAGQAEWTATVVFKADSTLGQGGATRPSNPQPNNLRHWWSNAALVGRELPGADEGDWGIFMNAEDELVCGNGGSISTGCIWQDYPMADHEWHAATVTFSTTDENRTLYVDGRAVRGQQNVTINLPADSINFGCNILGSATDRAYFTGHLKTVILEDRALSFEEVQDLHASLGFAESSWLGPVTREEVMVDLFNGSNFNEWGMSIQNNSGSTIGDDIWEISTSDDSAFAAADGQRQSALYTLRQDYGSYELTLEYMYTELDKGPSTGNSGIWILGGPDFVDSAEAFPASIEMQLRKGYEGDLLRKQLYLEAEPGWPTAPDQNRPDHRIIRRANPEGNTHGVWHSVRIVTEVTTNQGSTISVWINDVFVNKGINCERTSGYICLQAEGADIKFRNVKIRENKLAYNHWIERFNLPAGVQAGEDKPTDEFTNFEKYALGLDPSVAHERADALAFNNLVLRYIDPLYTADAILQMQVSSNLTSWTDITLPSVGANEGFSTNEQAVVPLESSKYYRLQVLPSM